MSESTPLRPTKALEDPESLMCPVCGKPLVSGAWPHCAKAGPHGVVTIESSRGLGLGIAVGVIILLFLIFLLVVWGGLIDFFHQWANVHRF
jgi:hypothetical protein